MIKENVLCKMQRTEIPWYHLGLSDPHGNDLTGTRKADTLTE